MKVNRKPLKYIGVVIGCLTILASCSSKLFPQFGPEIYLYNKLKAPLEQPEIVKLQSYNSDSNARIRLYYDQNSNIKLFENETCTSWKQKNSSSYKTLKEAIKSNQNKYQIVLNGMPATKSSHNLLTIPQNKWASKTVFQEKIIDASKPTILVASRVTGIDMVTSCNITVEFSPEKGKDYEAFYAEKKIGAQSYCTITLRTISKDKEQESDVFQTEDMKPLQKCI